MRKLIASIVTICLASHVFGIASREPGADSVKLLLANKRTLKKSDAFALKVIDHLRLVLQSSEQYQLITFNPKNPTIKRAIIERSLTADDLAEPLTVSAIQHICQIVGAKSLCLVDISLDSKRADCEYQIQTLMRETWVTRTASSVHFDLKMPGSKRKTSEKEIELGMVDTLANELGVKSALATHTIDEPKRVSKILYQGFWRAKVGNGR